MSELTTIELCKENMDFSSGHYTIFSPTHREPLHGHTFRVYAAITAKIDKDNGIAFDYATYKTKLRALCDQLNSYFLIAGESPHQELVEEGDYVYVHFHNEKIPFLKRDIIILPIKNITLEELSRWFIKELISDQTSIQKYGVKKIIIKVSSAPGQWASMHWNNDDYSVSL